MSTQIWTPDNFATMGDDILRSHGLNFLNFPGAKITEHLGTTRKLDDLIDGTCGIYADTGRVFTTGRMVYLCLYLGAERHIKQIKMYTDNPDVRANQDYEVRFANNAQNPGLLPKFDGPATLSTGDTIIGPDRGGFKTSFREETPGQYLGNGKYDWVEIRFWGSYPQKVGQPSKQGAAVVEALTDPKRETVDLGNNVKLELVEIPSGKFVIGDDSGDKFEANRNVVTIERPFLMSTTEITNEMYVQFDPKHESGVISGPGKDQASRGFMHDFPLQPVVRVSWDEAQKFCDWLSQRTGRKFRLPTEAQWEWAAKAGTDRPFWWGDNQGDFVKYANLADAQMRLIGRKESKDDKQFIPGLTWNDAWRMFRKDNVMEGNRLDVSPIECIIPVAGVPAGKGTARDEANPWGLYDMIGNVAEWTRSDFKPYPYCDTDGRNNNDPTAEKVVRGGSWHEPLRTSRSGSRLAYPGWQRVFDVGFRVICEE